MERRETPPWVRAEKVVVKESMAKDGHLVQCIAVCRGFSSIHSSAPNYRLSREQTLGGVLRDMGWPWLRICRRE